MTNEVGDSTPLADITLEISWADGVIERIEAQRLHVSAEIELQPNLSAPVVAPSQVPFLISRSLSELAELKLRLRAHDSDSKFQVFNTRSVSSEHCSVRDDTLHCQHWFDGQPCCACGDDSGQVDGKHTCQYSTRVSELEASVQSLEASLRLYREAAQAFQQQYRISQLRDSGGH